MAVSNIENIGKGLNILKEGLAPYIRRELKEYYKGNWWTDGIERALQYNAGSNASWEAVHSMSALTCWISKRF